ncbi:adhesion G protein-coupled receptor E5 isoform X1 [Myxocyprinus asiaticus]|uniref:adhesion G protein-coupled receptor E5 isoform X1 n=1 Tax=Myxocyprinus asiaticus TaxID=70543 RepID=UPI0022236443|nr:adhesion G protein-coupled receptor E5 isoform X1 [Myxocyprinus asiaticus]
MELKWTLLLLGLFLPSCSGCAIGFRFVKKKCVDENECEINLNPCGDHSHCVNTEGSYYCTCHEGFRSKTDNFTATTGECEDINECIENESVCSLHSVCVNTIGSFKCRCLSGYQVTHGGNGECKDVNECESSVCGAHSTCTNTPGSFSCSCSSGFYKHEKNSTCTDIDECADVADLCGSHANCNNTQGSYSCICHRGYSNYGNNQSKCIEMNCEQFKPEDETHHTPEKLKSLLSLLMKSCKSLNDSDAERFTGEELLENLCMSSDEMLSEGNLADSETLSQFLGAMENSMRLIGPQLKEPVTRLETHNTYAEVAVRRDEAPPTGSVILSTDSAHFNTSWKTVVGKSYPGFAFVALVSYKDLNSSSNSFNKISRISQQEDVSRERSDTKEGNITYQLNSRVVTAVVSNPETKHLSDPVTLVFKHVQERAESKGMYYSCVYWNETQGAWSGRGCVRAWSNSTHTVCSCSHLSSFAVLMALYPIKDTFALVLITRVGLVLSLICLLLCILTFRFCHFIQGTRNSIHLHLSVCLFIADLVFLCGISSTYNKGACAFVAGLLHFFFLAAFCWMLLEGVQLYRMVVLVFQSTLKHLYMYAVGYGAPLVIVTISAIVNWQGYGTDRHCWLSLDNYFILSFFVPVCIIIIINSIFFIITVWKLAKKFSSLNPDLSKLHKIRRFTVTAVAQLCVLGGMWVFGFFLFQEEGTQVMLYLFTILSSLQGALMFILHCLLSKTVRGEYYKLFSRIWPQKKKAEYSTNQSSNSQQPLQGNDSTGESQI